MERRLQRQRAFFIHDAWDLMIKLYFLTPHGLYLVMTFVGSVMLWTIPFAIAGRGNRVLFLVVLPTVLTAWICLGAHVSHALGVSMHFKADNGMRAAALVPLFFYAAVPVVVCISARLFGNWRVRKASAGTT